MNVFLFPGQGSQEIGMAADLFKADPAFRDLVQHASERAGADLERLCRRGPERELVRTRNLQPLMVCVSLGYLRHLTAAGVKPDRVLGHSLGEIAALAAAGSVSSETAVDIAAKRGELMDAAATRWPGGMVAVITSEREAIRRFLAETVPAGKLVLANDNAPNQIVLSGEDGWIEQAIEFINRGKLGQCRRLPVAGPWHSPAMAPAREEFEKWLRRLSSAPRRCRCCSTSPPPPKPTPAPSGNWSRATWSNPSAGASAWTGCGPPARPRCSRSARRRVVRLARANGFGDATRISNVNNLRGVELAAGPTVCDSHHGVKPVKVQP